MKKKNYKKIAKEVIDLEIKALKKLKSSINQSFNDAVDAIAKCQSKVILCGVGKSGLIASKISATLSSVGTPSFSLSANDCSHGDLGSISKKDILILISYSGSTEELKNILDTKIASKLARSYSDSHSLKTLIKEFINIDVSKQFQSSDFGGELSPAQLKYCANDVIYLHEIHAELSKILVREKRIDLYNNCLKFLKTRVDLDLALFKDDIWAH